MNTRQLIPLAIVCSLLSMSAAVPAQSEHIKQQTIERSFPVNPGSRVVIDSVNGSIRVLGYSGKEVRVVVHEKMQGRSASDLQQAVEEIVLEIDADDNEVGFYVRTPGQNCASQCSRSRNRHYSFSHNFELQVPYGVVLELRTVNDGDIRVDDVRSVVELENVNGKIEALGILGINNVRTVNGEIVLGFLEMPRDGGSVVTVNGDVELVFPSTPNVHVSMKTFNGGLFSEFAYKRRDNTSHIESKRSDGTYVYTSSGGTEISIGKGGPHWFLETLNGDIYIRKDDRS